ncbi:hypothetical protein CDAR_305631 [Caerostris darwini]|uniref:Uncharacterized protein n=1 Tax=Caerostris darwini TaxID=1538125 RepID=A0AAV4P8P7_9ARAC|nr:hypothetical protein CDAR_305631 [Caerostris darwini]
MEKDIKLEMWLLHFYEKKIHPVFHPPTHNTPAPSRTQRKPATSRCLRFITFPLSNANAGVSPGPTDWPAGYLTEDPGIWRIRARRGGIVHLICWGT